MSRYEPEFPAGSGDPGDPGDPHDESLWETPAAGVRRLKSRGGDGSQAGAFSGGLPDAGEWQQAPGAGGGAHVWVPQPARGSAHGTREDFATRRIAPPDFGASDGGPPGFDPFDGEPPDHEPPGFEPPNSRPPGFGPPASDPPGFGLPAFEPPDFEAPDFDPPDFAPPGFGLPAFGPPDFGAPDFDPPEFGASAAASPPRSPFAAALTTLAAPPPRRRFPAKALAALALVLAALAAAAVVLLPSGAAWPPPGWIFAACDVGQGDGLVLADGPHTAVVVDTGPDPAKMDRCLTGLGVTHVRLLLLTHFHADHIDGVPGVLDHRSVDEIETTVLDDPPDGAAKVAAWAAAAGVPVSRAARGEHRDYGAVAWDVLWPDPALLAAANAPAPSSAPTSKRSRRSRGPHRSGGHGGGSKSEEGSAPNNASIVLHVRATTADGPVTLLLTGDIEPPAQAAILAETADVASDILKVPHHGSAHQDPDLVARVRPRAAVVSVGRGNTYGHPAPRTLTLAASTGARVFRTDDDGTVLVVGPASQLHVVLRR